MDKNIDKLISLSMQISKIMSQQSDFSIEEKAATILQYHVLSFLHEQPQAKLSAVAIYLHSSLSSTTQLIERMYKAGLVTRQQDKKDRRITHLSLTKNGVAKLNQLQELRHKKMKNLLSHIPEKDIQELIRIQETLVNNLKENVTL